VPLEEAFAVYLQLQMAPSCFCRCERAATCCKADSPYLHHPGACCCCFAGPRLDLLAASSSLLQRLRPLHFTDEGKLLAAEEGYGSLAAVAHRAPKLLSILLTRKRYRDLI
jgi:hypothetical protein